MATSARPISAGQHKSRLTLIVAALITLAIFLLDAFSYFDIAVAVLYVLVVLVVASTESRRATVLAGYGCIALTLLGYALSHQAAFSPGPFVRTFVCIFAIATTMFLASRNLAHTASLREQVRLLDLTHDAIVVYDLDDAITFWNRGAQELYGWTAQEALGRKMYGLVPTAFPAARDAIRRDLLRADRWEGELVQTRRDGSPVTVSIRWSLWRDRTGHPVAILSTSNDVTQARATEQALQRSTTELAHVMRVTALGELAASIAHEVSQPIAAIVTNGDAGLRWLKRGTPDLGEACSVLENMVRDAERASNIIRRIRALAQKRDPQYGALDPNVIIEESIDLVRSEISKLGASLTVALLPDAPAIFGDRVQLQQVMINLLINSLQAMAQVGDRPRQLVVRTERPDAQHVLFTVRDSGSGITAEDESRLFDAFFTTKADGMGIGLSICRHIIEAHAGRIWATRGEHFGVTIQFVLPAYDNDLETVPMTHTDI